MSCMGAFPISVLMERRTGVHRWVDEVWCVQSVVAGHAEQLPSQDLQFLPPPLPNHASEQQRYLVSGLMLELHPDENDGYFENWAAPEPKVFVLWRMQEARAIPVLASVSYAEGARMLDSGEAVDGVAMPPAIHAWLGDYLLMHYRGREAGHRHGRRTGSAEPES